MAENCRRTAHPDQMGSGIRLGRRLRELDCRAGARRDRPYPCVRTDEVRRRLGLDELAGRVRWPWSADVLCAGVPARGERVRRAAPDRNVFGDSATGRSGDRPVGGHAGAVRAICACDASDRYHRLSAVFGNRSRIRPGRRPDEGSRTEWPVDDHRAQGVDVRRPGRRRRGSRCAAPTPRRPNTRASRCSWSRWMLPESPSGPSAR